MRAFLFAILLSLAVPAHAGDVAIYITPAQLKAQFQAWNFEVFAHEDEFDRPQLLVEPLSGEGNRFGLLLLNCKPDGETFMNSQCDGFEFRAYMRPGFPIDAEVYEKWNSSHGRARAFVFDGFTNLAWYIHVGGGFVWTNIQAQLAFWQSELAEYKDYLDASIMD
ncbi:MAG: YbjN domain-containing protein [Magnetovibrio sp.]|nr:YbjN domain-containing protein [Magnetovibrio sp.]